MHTKSLVMEEKLKQLRRYKLIENIILLGGLLLGLVIRQNASPETLKIFGIVFIISLLVSTLFVMSRKCPKCGNYYHGSNAFWGNTLRSSCAHCGLHISGNNA